jgi:hypothetical protein
MNLLDYSNRNGHSKKCECGCLHFYSHIMYIGVAFELVRLLKTFVHTECPGHWENLPVEIGCLLDFYSRIHGHSDKFAFELGCLYRRFIHKEMDTRIIYLLDTRRHVHR